MGILGPDLLIRVLNQSFTQTCKIHVRRGERTIVGIKLLNIFQTTHVKNIRGLNIIGSKLCTGIRKYVMNNE